MPVIAAFLIDRLPGLGAGSVGEQPAAGRSPVQRRWPLLALTHRRGCRGTAAGVWAIATRSGVGHRRGRGELLHA